MTTLYLRTVNADYTSHGGFKWPREIGAVVEAPDWDPAPVCGGGLHGLPWGQGHLNLLSSADDAVWLVVAADHAVRIDNAKSKFPRCTIVYVGSRDGACAYLLERAPRDTAVPYIRATAGDRGTATAGYMGTLVIAYRDKTRRRRLCVGYVGEDGIMPGTAYRVINGKLTNKAEITS